LVYYKKFVTIHGHMNVKLLKISLVYALPEDSEEMTPKPVGAETNKRTVQQADIKYFTCNT